MNIFKKLTALILAGSLFTGCAAIHTAVKKSDLEVSTQMSETVWLDPVGPEKKTVFIQLRDTSDKQGIVQSQAIIDAIINKGYKIVQDPEKAQYWLMMNVRKVGKADLRDTSHWLSQGYGAAITGGVVGSTIGQGSGRVAGGLIGAAAGLIGDALVEDVLFTIITDLKISEKAKKGVSVSSSSKHNVQNGLSGSETQTSNETKNRKDYYTRIVATANQANLKFEEARPELVKGLVKVVSGIL